MRLLFLISDHGFGHAGRCCAVLPHLIERGVPLLIVSGVPLAFFVESLLEPDDERLWRDAYAHAHASRDEADRQMLRDLMPHVKFLHLPTDVGVRQRDAISIDVPATLAALDNFFASFDDVVAAIVDEARFFRASAVLFDISALGPSVARQLGVPACALSNFTWDFVYDALAPVEPAFGAFAAKHVALYGGATHAIALPAATPMPALEHCVRAALPGWTGRRSTRARADTRRVLGMRDDVRYVLLTFGGHAALNVGAAVAQPGWRVVRVDASPLAANEHAADVGIVELGGALVLRLAALRETSSVRFVDVVAAADVVVTKPGYGTVAELVINGVPSLWVSRPGFAEEPFLVRELESASATLLIDAALVLSPGPPLFEAAARVLALHESEWRGRPPVALHNETVVQLVTQWFNNAAPAPPQ